jgi:hypothetical protein
MIIIRDKPGIKILPKPKLQVPASPQLIKVRDKVPGLKVSPEDEGYSLDEKTQLILDQIAEEAQYLDDNATRDLWLDGIETFKGTGDIEALVALTVLRRQIVPLDEFMFGKAYLGLEEDTIYPGVLEACAHLDSDQYLEAVFKGALGGGKTTTSNIMMGRTIYKISCMRHPQSTFGIQAKSSLVITIQSVRLQTAKKAVFEEFGKYLKESPYFSKIYPFDPLVSTQMIFREQNLSVLPVAASGTGVISMNVIAGILDEMNFMAKIQKSKSSQAGDDGGFDQAKQIYEAISRRRKSRFAKMGKLPGILFLVSSSRFPDDFTEKKAAESTMCGGTDPSIYVYSKSVWESKGRDQFLPGDFRVQVGNATIRSKILGDDEPEYQGCQVVLVPDDFRSDFEKDVDGSLRDLAGVTTLSTRPFITRRDTISHAIENGEEAGYVNPFHYEQYDFSRGIPRVKDDHHWRNPHMFRACHIDLGLKRDACGISVGHVAGQKLIERTDNVTGLKTSELMPVVGIDVIMRVVPPQNGEIEFAQIRKFLTMLRDEFGLPIEYITMDGFQSVDSRQILKTLGFKTDYLSVEKIDHYRSLRDALYDGRINMFRHNFVVDELASLEYVPAATAGKEDKVDHRANGTKDVSDAVCGVTSFLLKRRIAWSGIIARTPPRAGANEFSTNDPDLQVSASVNPNKLGQVLRRSTERRSVYRRNMSRR